MTLNVTKYISSLWETIADIFSTKGALGDVSQKLGALATDTDAALTALNSALAADQPYLVPQGAIILWLGSACPTGYTEVTAFQNAFPMGNPSGGTVGQTGGAASHSQTVSATTGAPSNSISIAQGTGTVVPAGDDTHTHDFSVTSGTASNLPPYIQTLFCQKT